ncbi:hypothetical protein GOZ93_00790 [Agrobacterium vitis]|uniref:hypothetical protein n=1 Tax=Agrobacterium vitis TaxID=373 RepID=UPI0012E81273|nr:hypothetical protein [Agrobacterium vitis]MUZ80774.1 hypothetical protein [Agrobacterium vitis]
MKSSTPWPVSPSCAIADQSLRLTAIDLPAWRIALAIRRAQATNAAKGVARCDMAEQSATFRGRERAGNKPVTSR